MLYSYRNDTVLISIYQLRGDYYLKSLYGGVRFEIAPSEEVKGIPLDGPHLEVEHGLRNSSIAKRGGKTLV